MSTDEKKKSDDEMMDAIVRKPGRPPKVDPGQNPVVAAQAGNAGEPQSPPADPILSGVVVENKPPFESSELAQLREDNAMLMKLVMEMKAKLMPDADERAAASATDFQKKKSFSKVRGMDVGVYYVQNGRKYNGKFELVPDKA